LGELLARLEVRASFARAVEIDARERLGRRADAGSAIAHVWIDLRRADGVLLYIADKGLDRVLVRRVPVGRVVDEVAREELAHIVEASVDALLQGGQIGVAVDRKSLDDRPKEPPVEREVERPPVPRATTLALGLGYEAEAWAGGQTPMHGPLASVELVFGGGDARPGLALSGQWRFPHTVESAPLGLRLDEQALRVAGTLDVKLGGRWVFRWALGGGLDVVHSTPLAFGADRASVEPATIALDPVLRAGAAVTHEFADGKRLALGAAAELDLVDTRYYVDLGSNSEVVLRPWRMRPCLVLEIAADVLTSRGAP
jgi:hypothetical protein